MHNLTKHRREKHAIDYATYNSVDHIIRHQFLDAIHPNYKTAFYMKELGYRCTSFQQVATYMIQEHGTKSNKELTVNSYDQYEAAMSGLISSYR
jgi:hypothetical protein